MAIKHYTYEELQNIREGKSKTDFKRLKEMTEEELEESIKSDEDWKDVPEDWYSDAKPVNPK